MGLVARHPDWEWLGSASPGLASPAYELPGNPPMRRCGTTQAPHEITHDHDHDTPSPTAFAARMHQAGTSGRSRCIGALGKVREFLKAPREKGH